MINLNDTQLMILSSASQRESGALLPLPKTLTSAATAKKTIVTLISHGFAEEREAGATDEVFRQDGDLRYSLFVTAAGLAAIGVGDVAGDAEAVSAAPLPARTSKSTAVVALLERGEGATLPELIAATGWLPHTTRAALTGLRKKGHAISRGKRDGATCYTIVAVA